MMNIDLNHASSNDEYYNYEYVIKQL